MLINEKPEQGNHSTKMGADKSAENLPKLSAQAQKIGISMKKGLGVRSP